MSDFIFRDFRGRRWRRFQCGSLLLLVVAILGVTVFVRSLLVLPRLRMSEELRNIDRDLKALLTSSNEKIHLPSMPPPWLTASPSARIARPVSSLRVAQNLRAGHYVEWDPQSFESLARNASSLTHVIAEGIYLTNSEARVKGTIDQRLLEFIAGKELSLLALIMNLEGDNWQPEVIEHLSRQSPAEQREFAAEVASRLTEIGAAGAVFDWEQLDPSYSQELTGLVRVVSEVFREQGLELWLSIPVGNDIKIFDLHALSPHVTRFLAMLYDENGERDQPGPTASQPWFADWLRVLLEHGRSEQWVIGIGAFAYDWGDGRDAQQISFADTMVRASMAEEGRISSNTPHYQPHFLYADEGVPHTVWFLDAATFRNQMALAESYGVGGFAVYRLGTEDPGVWKVLAHGAAGEIEKIRSEEIMAHVGDGDFLYARNERADGARKIALEQGGLWAAEYLVYPRYPMIYHEDARSGDEVAITFDDGPSADWTPLVLDILKEQEVKAAFFVTGKNALAYPALVKRIVEEGHEIGNHSFSHPDLSRVSDNRMVLELNATQRAIEALTGFSSVLFRPPYSADRRPVSYDEFLPLVRAQELGYVTVSNSVDTEDWDEAAAEDLVRRVKTRRAEGNVVLMHDGGGDRSQTVAALPEIISYLRKRGDRIVPLHRLLGTSRAGLMPAIPQDDPAQSRVLAQTGLRFLRITEETLWAFMIVTTALVLLRTLIVVAAALIQHRQEKKLMSAEPIAPVSVLLAAYNEEKVIGSTLRSVLASRYLGPLEVLVVDDGSSDKTASVVSEIARRDARVRLIRQENLGKARALANGISHARNELLVMLDADTQFQADTLRELIAALVSDPRAGAVSGHAKVGNIDSWFSNFQSLEYICGFNLDRRAYDALNAITVVPGCVSAYRKSFIEQAGGMSHETLAEDTDLTLSLHRIGAAIRYNPRAVAWTEAPATMGALLKQRERWAFGTLQCVWKHRDLLFHPAFGALAFFSLPSIWFCHVFLVALVPLIDALLLISIVTGSGSAILNYAVLFLLVDVVLGVAGCLMEGEPVKRALLIVPMRFLYRPLLSFAVWRSLIRALKGAWFDWGKLERTGTVVPAKAMAVGE